MKPLKIIRPFFGIVLLLLLAATSPAQVTFTDNFSTSANYLTGGVAGTIWDGIYLGAGEFKNTGLGTSAGSTVVANADISAVNTLTLQTTETDWEGVNDDGFFLFKVVPGDFSASVQIITPYNKTAYNTAGLQVRAFSPGGNPFNGSENFVSWTRFDEYGFANYLRNNIPVEPTALTGFGLIALMAPISIFTSGRIPPTPGICRPSRRRSTAQPSSARISPA
jgi:hypothetical protein